MSHTVRYDDRAPRLFFLAAVVWAVIRTNPGEGCLYVGFLALYLLFYAMRVR